MYMICIFLFLCLNIYFSHATVHMEQHDWYFLETHPVHNKMTFSDNQLKEIVAEEWKAITSICPTLDPNANIQAFFDTSLSGSTTLAWASHTMYISNNIWYPALINVFYNGYDFRIGVNPTPPNGWYDGDCSDISYRYDLRTVIRHELLHGVGISSSITYDKTWTVGDYQMVFCFPRLFDTKIKDVNGNYIVDGCSISDISNKKLYVGGVELYNPSTFNSGSSISHHNYPGYLFYYRSEPMKCMSLSTLEFKILAEIGIPCSSDQVYFPSASTTTEPSLLLLACCCILFFLAL